MAKFHEAILFGSKVFAANMLNFNLFSTPLKKFVCGGSALARLGHSLARVKIWGRSTS